MVSNMIMSNDWFGDAQKISPFIGYWYPVKCWAIDCSDSTHCNDDDGDTGVGPDSATQTCAGAG